MKEACRVWHETAMGMESVAVNNWTLRTAGSRCGFGAAEIGIGCTLDDAHTAPPDPLLDPVVAHVAVGTKFHGNNPATSTCADSGFRYAGEPLRAYMTFTISR